jgi:hypothetical protein
VGYNYSILITNGAEKVKERVGPGPPVLTGIGFYPIVVPWEFKKFRKG